MERLIKILNEIKPGIDFEKEENLIESKILTSFDIVRLVVALDEEFDIEISPIHLLPENFKSARNIYALIEKIQEEE